MKCKVKQKAEGELPDLNKCTARTLTKSIGLSPKLAADIVAYRRRIGNFDHIRDLWDVENMTMPLFEFLVSNYTVHKRPKRRKSKSLKRVKRKTRLVKRAGSKKTSKRKARRKTGKRIGKINRSILGRGSFDKTMITMNPVDVMQSASGNALTVVYRAVPPVMRTLEKSGKAAQAAEDLTLNTRNIDSSNKEPPSWVRTAGKSDKQNDEKEAILGNKRDGFRTESQTGQNRKRNYDRETLVQSKHPASDSGKIGKGPLNQGVQATGCPDASLTVDHVRSAQADHEKPNRLKSIEKWINDVEQTTMKSASRADRKSLSGDQAGKRRESKFVTLKAESSKYGSALPGSPEVNERTTVVKVDSRGTSRTNEKTRSQTRNEGSTQKHKDVKTKDIRFSMGVDNGEGQRSDQMKDKASKFEPFPGTSGVKFQVSEKSTSSKKQSNNLKNDLGEQQRKRQQGNEGEKEVKGKDDDHRRRHHHHHRRHGDKHRSHRERDHKSREGRPERDQRKERSRDRHRSHDKSESKDTSCSIM